MRIRLIALCILCFAPPIAGRADEPHPTQLLLPLVMPAGDSAPTRMATWSTPITLSPDGAEVWVVNPDADSVSVVDAGQLVKSDEILVGRSPWALAIAPDGTQIYVINRGDGSLSIIDAASRQVWATIPVGPEPGGIALNRTGTQAYVTVTAANTVAVIDTAQLTVTATLPVAPLPYGVAVSAASRPDEQDERVLVTHLLAQPQADGIEGTDDGRTGWVSLLAVLPLQVAAVISLAPDEHGFPNLLTSIAIAGERAWLPHVRSAPALPNGLRTTVFAAVTAVDLNTLREERAAYLPLNDEELFGSPVNNPVAAIPSPDGRTLYVVLAGSNLIEVIDVANPAAPRLVRFLPTGANPRGMAVSADGRRGFVMNYLARSITVLDLVNLAVEGEVPVTAETLDAEVLRGKVLFHNATDPRLSRGSWISCASCHPDGGTDGVTWFFPDGPRQTPPLWNAGATLPWHWSAALDEPQDVEDTIHTIQHGLGLAPGADPPLLGAPNAGRSADLDALAAFMVRGIVAPVAPPPTPAAAEGRRLFEAAGCATCHGGPHWTISALPGPAGTLDPNGSGMVDEVLREVGTLNPLDLRGATGFDVPSLLGVGLTAPYFHDGSMPTLEALLASGHPDPQGEGNKLSEDEIVMVSSFLRSIDASTPPLGAQQSRHTTDKGVDE
jgi:YVTN family beta-propeller protein